MTKAKASAPAPADQTQAVELAKPNSLMGLERELAFIEQQLISSGGELTPELDAWYSEVAANAAKKIDSIKYVADGLDAKAETLKAMADEFTRAARARSNTAARVRDIIKQAMQMRGMDELHGSLWRAKLSRTAPKITVVDEAEIPQEFFVTVPQLNREALTRALKAGHNVPGCTVDENKALCFYVQTNGDA